MKKFLSIIFLNIFLCSVLCATAFGKISDTEGMVTLDRIVAVVNDDLITQSELDQREQLVRKELTAADVVVPDDSVFRQRVLQQLIDETLQLQVAKNIGIHIDDQALNKALDEIAARNHMTLNELYLSAQREGWSIETFRERIRKEVSIQELQKQEVAARIHISDQEIGDFLRSGESVQKMPAYHLADVLIALPENPSSKELKKAQEQAKSVIDQLVQGADFHQMAVTTSSGRNALQGGDLGWRKLPELPEAFAKRVQSMEVGSVAGPIRTPNGFHVIKLLEVKRETAYKVDEENEVQIIFVSKSKSGQEKINKIFKFLQKEMDFTSLAKRYSEDTKTAIVGGYLGWVTLDELNKPVREAVLKLSVGQVSDPVATDQGWYIVKVLAKREVPKVTKSEKEKIQELLFQRKLNENLQTFITNLRNESYVKIY
jgi:peptidyl-prolyl cis-trans isomerase SurA